MKRFFLSSPWALGLGIFVLIALPAFALVSVLTIPELPDAVGRPDPLPSQADGGPEALEIGLKPIEHIYYKVKAGDTISGIATEHNLKSDTLLTYNEIKRSRAMQIGTLLKVPNQDGLLYIVKSGDSLVALAEKFEIPTEDIQRVNRMDDVLLAKDSKLFLPGARLNNAALKEINGDLFRPPVRNYRLTSYYGYRRDPFTGTRSFHNGLDMAAPLGTAVYAPMDGTVTSTGYSNGTGNYIVIRHHGGYSTLYGHLSGIEVSSGVGVKTGALIGRVGNSGYSTGSHLHFTVYQNGRTINPIYVLN